MFLMNLKHWFERQIMHVEQVIYQTNIVFVLDIFLLEVRKPKTVVSSDDHPLKS